MHQLTPKLQGHVLFCDEDGISIESSTGEPSRPSCAATFCKSDPPPNEIASYDSGPINGTHKVKGVPENEVSAFTLHYLHFLFI